MIYLKCGGDPNLRRRTWRAHTKRTRNVKTIAKAAQKVGFPLGTALDIMVRYVKDGYKLKVRTWKQAASIRGYRWLIEPSISSYIHTYIHFIRSICHFAVL